MGSRPICSVCVCRGGGGGGRRRGEEEAKLRQPCVVGNPSLRLDHSPESTPPLKLVTVKGSLSYLYSKLYVYHGALVGRGEEARRLGKGWRRGGGGGGGRRELVEL